MALFFLPWYCAYLHNGEKRCTRAVDILYPTAAMSTAQDGISVVTGFLFVPIAINALSYSHTAM
ncbi:MAG: hypothetical protein LZT29_02853 [Pantoea stewartii]|nr:MAG: hypothetical protein LZT29_02853 [Pantoea stewartii]